MKDITLTASRMEEESIFERKDRKMRLAKNKKDPLNNTMIIIHGFSVLASRHITRLYRIVTSGLLFRTGNIILKRKTKIHNSTKKRMDSVR